MSCSLYLTISIANVFVVLFFLSILKKACILRLLFDSKTIGPYKACKGINPPRVKQQLVATNCSYLVLVICVLCILLYLLSNQINLFLFRMVPNYILISRCKHNDCFRHWLDQFVAFVCFLVIANKLFYKKRKYMLLDKEIDLPPCVVSSTTTMMHLLPYLKVTIISKVVGKRIQCSVWEFAG